jgi:hypothetical protein
MTTATLPVRYTASWLLSGAREQATEGVGRALDAVARSGALGPVSGPMFASLRQRLADATYGLLDLDLGELLIGGWRVHTALRSAALSTVDNPHATELVELAAHVIEVVHHPSIDVVVNGYRAATIAFELKLSLEIDGLLGQVQRGRLVGLQIARCIATATLAYEGMALVSGRAELDPGVIVSIGRGVPLIPDTRNP